MERIAFATVLLLSIGYTHGQNLVPNGSFEEYDACPEFAGYAQYATGWLNLHTNSADYFNRCQENSVTGVPFNTCGYQEPADGDAYIGIATTFPGLDWYREIVGIELAEPLQVGIPVCLSFKMALGGFGSWDGNSAMFTSKGVGMRFFHEFPTDWHSYLYPNSAALYMEAVPMDTSIWYQVSGIYVPDSDYVHLAVGNFFADSMSSILPLDTSGFGAAGVSYAFIDDVRVSYDMQYCGSTGVHSSGPPDILHVYPNPFVDRFTVSLPESANGMQHWELMDVYGHPVLSGSDRPYFGTFTISTGHIASGTYVLHIHDGAGIYVPVRLVSLSR